MTLTGNIIKYWTLRKTGKQEPSRSQSTQKKTSTYQWNPSIYQIFRNQNYEKAKQRKQQPKLQHLQTKSAKVRQQVVSDRSATKVNQSETTLKYFDPLRTHKYHTHTFTHSPSQPIIIFFVFLRSSLKASIKANML